MTQPTLPYGSCLATLPSLTAVLDLTPDMQVATGRAVLAQSLIRRQTTPRGSVITSPNDCIAVQQLLSAGMTQAALAALAGAIRQELLKDQRVNAVSVTISLSPTNVATISEQIQSSTGPFSLTLTLTNGTITQIVAGQ
jgi:hypothetical protein